MQVGLLFLIAAILVTSHFSVGEMPDHVVRLGLIGRLDAY